MFQLESKDAQAHIADFEQLLISMTWYSPAAPNNVDLDLFAVYEAKDGRKGIVYHNNPEAGSRGDMNMFPFMKLSEDAGDDDDDAGTQEETLTIVSLAEMKFVWLCCWDYPNVESGQPGRLTGCNLKINIMDDKGSNIQVPMVSSTQGNMARIATIDNSSPISVKLLNTSSAGMLNGLNANALIEFLQQS